MTDEKKYLNNNISKHFSIIKTFMRWASEKEYHANTKFEQIKYQSDVVDVLALTEEELEKITNVNLSFSKSLEKTRDIFVFGCLTGQRYSDLKNLKLGDLNLESVNPTWSLYQVKGNKRKKIIVPLLPKAIEILTKYVISDNPIECYAFKIQCNQKMNQNIKVVAELAKVNTPVPRTVTPERGVLIHLNLNISLLLYTLQERHLLHLICSKDYPGPNTKQSVDTKIMRVMLRYLGNI
jgi:integrase